MSKLIWPTQSGMSAPQKFKIGDSYELSGDNYIYSPSLKSARNFAVKRNKQWITWHAGEKIIISSIKLHRKNVYSFKTRIRSKKIIKIGKDIKKSVKKVTTKSINKKIYRLNSSHVTKKLASKEAKKLKQNGFFVRIIKSEGRYKVYKNKK